jgi:hypothetical protein
LFPLKQPVQFAQFFVPAEATCSLTQFLVAVEQFVHVYHCVLYFDAEFKLVQFHVVLTGACFFVAKQRSSASDVSCEHAETSYLKQSMCQEN